jgi:methylphosphotriester-DNA--protein-cysteine methyltransferase
MFEYCRALYAADESIRAQGRQRLYELYPLVVVATAGDGRYHQPACAAVRAGVETLHFADWEEAELAGYDRCSVCRPPRELVSSSFTTG